MIVVSPAVVRAYRHAHQGEEDRLLRLPEDQAGDVDYRATEAGVRAAIAQHHREALDELAAPLTPVSETPVLDAILAELGPVTEETA